MLKRLFDSMFFSFDSASISQSLSNRKRLKQLDEERRRREMEIDERFRAAGIDPYTFKPMKTENSPHGEQSPHGEEE